MSTSGCTPHVRMPLGILGPMLRKKFETIGTHSQHYIGLHTTLSKAGDIRQFHGTIPLRAPMRAAPSISPG